MPVPISPERVVIARIQRANFFQPVRLSSGVRISARVVHTTRHTVTVQATIEQVDRSRVRHGVSNTCQFTFHSVDMELEPVEVPFVYPATYAEDDRFLFAHRQRIEP